MVDAVLAVTQPSWWTDPNPWFNLSIPPAKSNPNPSQPIVIVLPLDPACKSVPRSPHSPCSIQSPRPKSPTSPRVVNYQHSPVPSLPYSPHSPAPRHRPQSQHVPFIFPLPDTASRHLPTKTGEWSKSNFLYVSADDACNKYDVDVDNNQIFGSTA